MAFAAQFPIEGRQTYSSVFVFQKRPSFFTFVPPKCSALLEAKLYPKDTWMKLLEFELNVPKEKVNTINGNLLLVISNDKDYKYQQE